MRRHRRRYHGIVKIPGLGFLNKSVNSTDLLIGAGVGLAGTAVAKWALKTFMPAAPTPVAGYGAFDVSSALKYATPLLGGAIVGTAAYFLQKKGNPSRATGHLVGALAAGASVTVMDVLRDQVPQYFGDVVRLPMNGMGILVNERAPRGMQGLIVNEPGVRRSMSESNLAQLAAYSMGDSDASGMEELMEMDE